MIDPVDVQTFLAGQRFALVGASDDPHSFSHTIQRELTARGYDVVGVNPSTAIVDGAPCYPNLASVPGDLDGAIVMVPKDRSAGVVRECADRGIDRVWLFKGIGGAGSVSAEAVALCHERGIMVVEGACPLMFLEPVALAHRVHRSVRRMKGAVGRAA